MNILSLENFTSTNLTTEEDGLFYFKGFQFIDTTELVIQANIHNSKKKGKQKDGVAKRAGNKNVEIELLKFNELGFNPLPGYLPATDSSGANNRSMKGVGSFVNVPMSALWSWPFKLQSAFLYRWT